MVDGEAVLCEIWDTCPKLSACHALCAMLTDDSRDDEASKPTSRCVELQEMAQNTGWESTTGGPAGPAIRLQSDGVPSNEQLVRGLIGTLMSLSSTLLQAIDDGGGLTNERAALQQSLTPIHDQLRQLLESIESRESQPEPASVPGTTAGPTFRQWRPRTAPGPADRWQPNGTATATRHFTPLATSTIFKPATTGGKLQLPEAFISGGSAIDSGHVTDHRTGATPESPSSFAVPSSWREIANASELLAELQAATEQTAGQQANQRARTLSVDRRPWNNHSRSMAKEAAIAAGHTSEKPYATVTVPGRAVEQFALRSLMLPPNVPATYSVRETNNCALPDGTFQRTTKTIAGTDASVLTNYQQQQQHQQRLMSTPATAFDCCGVACRPNVEENAEALNLTAGSESVQWADGLLLVYSITDRDSFNYIRRAKEELAGDTPVALVANKVDMVHLRQVSTEEGDILAKDFECKFCEISAAEHVYPVADAFLELCREVLTAKRKSKQSFIDKIDRMLSGSRAYNRGKSDSISPKD
uniref:small monomeric GTPase n=1 Tax=Anopheles albimanus TaxID=7167 RepID=A0A182FDH3_ANOAL